MPRYKLIIEYNGTSYNGWQIQKDQQSKTIQGTLLAAVEEVFPGITADLQGSGRTDAGVHALAQTAHLDIPMLLEPDSLANSLNEALPATINILAAEKAGDSFHARHNAIKRSYIYLISKRRTAFGKNFVFWSTDALSLDSMQQAGDLLKGFHDFAAFTTASLYKKKSTKVDLHSVECKAEGDIIVVRITASHFLRKMVRRIIGLMIETGSGRMNLETFGEFITDPSKSAADYTAPASGLYLEKVYYQKHEMTPPLRIPFLHGIHSSLVR